MEILEFEGPALGDLKRSATPVEVPHEQELWTGVAAGGVILLAELTYVLYQNLPTVRDILDPILPR